MDRGRSAERPREIPAAGWKDIAFRIKDEVTADHIGLIAAGVAFYSLLALFPAITACMAIAGILTEPGTIVDQLDRFAAPLPDEAASIILDQAAAVAGSDEGGLGLAAILGILIAIFSASRGMASLIEGMNVAYEEKDERGFLKGMLLNYALTLFLIAGFLIAMGVVAALPAVLATVGLGPFAEALARIGGWAALILLTMFGLAVLYRYAPDRERAKWRWITPGAAVATAIWLLASVAFSFYVTNFASYNETFGTLGGVVILLMWLWLSAYAILIGAETDSEIEAQTKIDSTTGPEKPMGERGATKADVLGEARS